MRKMLFGTISLLVACGAVYAAEGTEKPAVTPAATAPATTVPATPATAPATTGPATPAGATPAAAPPAATPATTPAATSPVTAAPAATTVSLSGKWSSNLVGDVIIEQTGNKIAGTYQYTDDDDVTQDGKFEGVIEGKTIKAKWWQRPKVGKGEESRGDLEWKITDDGKVLSGWYRDEGEKDKQDFNLER
ncbi:MAG: hypothetical protein LM523_10615 [Candidatus Contendobacter sp.]|nr:hypothetical protein [Candidatus Contendobacter sp.]